MKKYLPVIIFIVGIFVLAGVYFLFIRGGNDRAGIDEDETVAEIPFEQRPLVTLTPTEDGHYLIMNISGIDKMDLGAESLDYELLYPTAEGITQGVPGTAELKSNEIEREFLLGSESSGKFRYDEGVEDGTLTLKFRNGNGKLVGRLSTEWHLQLNTDTLTSVDGNFTYRLEKIPDDTYFVTVETFGVPQVPDGSPVSGPYGVFASSPGDFSGNIEMPGTVNYWDGSSWEQTGENLAPNIGIFIGL